MRSSLASCVFIRASKRSSRASISCVINSVTRQTDLLALLASKPSPSTVARCDFPVPGCPTKITAFPLVDINSPRKSSPRSHAVERRLGLELKSPNVLWFGKRAAFNRRSAARFSRVISSNSQSCSRKPRWSTFSMAQRAATYSRIRHGRSAASTA